MAEKRPKDKSAHLQTAALLKLSFKLAGQGSPGVRVVYEGVLRDYGLEDSDVQAYLDANYERLLKIARGKERGEP